MIFRLIVLLIIPILSSCSNRNLTYFSDLPKSDLISEIKINKIEPKIQPIDLLNITVSTLNPESNLLFNRGVLASHGGGGNLSGASTMINDGYRVDNNGYINFPVLGKINLLDLTLEEATERMTKKLQLEAKDPIVNIKLLNFRVTVIGEVNNPSTFPVISERINIIEAIGLAGDLTPFGRRENVLLMREKDGELTMARLNLNQKSLISSPYFYLQQNDIIYVEPDKARALQTNTTRTNITFFLAILNAAVIFAWRAGLF